jgi:hypothetical protein
MLRPMRTREGSARNGALAELVGKDFCRHWQGIRTQL